MTEREAEIVAKVLYDRIPALWQTQEGERGLTFTPWERLAVTAYARREALRIARAALLALERA